MTTTLRATTRGGIGSRPLRRTRDGSTPVFGPDQGVVRLLRRSDRELAPRTLDPKTESSNAAAYYRLLRSILRAAQEKELIDHVPSRILRAGNAPVRQVVIPATFDEITTIVNEMPERLELFTVLAAFVGLRDGELMELRSSDVDGITGRISVARKVDKDADPSVRGACPNCGSTRRLGAAPASCTSRRPSCPCCNSTSSSTPRRARRASSSLATAPTT